MKKLIYLTIASMFVMLFSSCSFNYATIMNQNQNSTQVHLAGNNFKVVQKVSGSAEMNYILIFGEMKKKQLFENAYSAMMEKASLMDGSRAIVNIVTEEHIGGLPPIYFTRTITVSAHVVEFTK